jgi:hypothetical protein
MTTVHNRGSGQQEPSSRERAATTIEANPTLDDDTWSAPGWRDAAVEYHKDRSNRAGVTPYMADELARLRELMTDNVSLDRAYAELNKRAPGDVPIATLQAAEYLAQQNDPQRLDDWLRPRSPDDRAAIRKHLSKRRGPS